MSPAVLVVAMTAASAVLLLLVAGTVAQRLLRRAAAARRRRRTLPLRELLMELVAGDAEESAAAAAVLGTLEATAWRAIEPSVAALLGKVRGDARAGVVDLLARRGVLDRALRDLRRRSAVRRCSGADLLGRAQVPTAVRALLPLLEDHDADVRQVAARALGSIRAPRAASPLLAALAARPGRVPVTVVAQALLRIGPPAAPALVEALTSPVPVVRTTAVQVLGRLGETSAGGALAERLREDDEPEVRARAATALGELGMPGALADLIAATMPDVPAVVRRAATCAMGRLGAAAGARALCALLDDDDERVASGAGGALLALGEVGEGVLRRVSEVSSATTGAGAGLLHASDRAREALAVAALRPPAALAGAGAR